MNSQIKIRCRAIITHGGKLFLVKHSGGRDFFSLPGGHMDYGEDPKECITREIQEEIGVVPTIGRLLYLYTFIKDDIQSVEFFFEVTNGEAFLAHAQNDKTHAHEIEEVMWMSQEDNVRVLPEEIAADFKNGTLFEETPRFLKA